MILDQFGKAFPARRVCGFVPPPAKAEKEDSEHRADAIASDRIYPEEVDDL
jgi:hypothetical protein